MIAPGVRGIDFVLQEEFEYSIDNYVAFYEDGAITVDCTVGIYKKWQICCFGFKMYNSTMGIQIQKYIRYTKCISYITSLRDIFSFVFFCFFHNRDLEMFLFVLVFLIPVIDNNDL